MRSAIFLAFFTVACNSGKTATVGDSAPTTSTTEHTGTTTSSGTTVPTSWDDWTLSGTLEVAADADVPTGDVIVALVTYDPFFYVHRDILVQANAGTLTQGGSLAYTLVVPGTPGASYFSSDPYNPSTSMAAFTVGAYIDENGDGLADADDTYIASSDNWFTLFTTPPQGEFAFSGFGVGWNEADLSDPWGYFITGLPLSGDVSNHAVDTNLVPTLPDGHLSLTIEPPEPPGPPVAVRAEVSSGYWLFGGTEPANPILWSEALSGSANETVQMTTPLPTPPADHLLEDFGGYYSLPGMKAAYYAMVAYPDLDGNGAWDFYTETNYASNWAGAPPLELMYLKPSSFDANGMAWWFGGTGWVLYEDGAGYYGMPDRFSFNDAVNLGEATGSYTTTTTP